MIKNVPHSEQPRERLMSIGAEALTNSELLAILIRTGSTKQSALEVGKALLAGCNDNLTELSEMTIQELCSFEGIGESKACQLLASLELGKRVKQTGILQRSKMSSPIEVVNFFNAELDNIKVEKFIGVFLNTKNEVINWEVISVGSLNASIVHPREVFNRAIRRNAASIIAVHNHPSGHISPSKEDINITKRLYEVGQLVGIPLIDHIIIGKNKYYSFKEENQL